MPVKIDVLDAESKVSKKGNAYHTAIVRYPAVSGRVGKIFSETPFSIGNNVNAIMEVAPNNEMFLAVRFSPAPSK